MTFYIRGSGDPETMISAARQAMAETDPDHPISNLQTMEEFLGDDLRRRRYSASVLAVFAVMATVLAAMGIYGAMAYSVSRRTAEIGIRMALGATAADIARLVSVPAMLLVAIGILLGLAVSAALAPLIETQLWGITATDPATYTAGAGLLVLVSLVACLHPLWRAVRVQPAAALRLG
jgi:ABC-type antimicrobial peptide transport system permease subunit